MKNEQYFYLEDGGLLRNIKELGLKLDEMPDYVFQHHVNYERNDFASWVEGVFNDKELAACLRTTNDKLRTQVIVLKHLLAQQRTKSIKKYKCNQCEKGFPTKVGLSVHKTVAHKKG
jgi:hypothetical protein